MVLSQLLKCYLYVFFPPHNGQHGCMKGITISIKIIVSHVWVSIGGVWFGDCVYWPLTNCNTIANLQTLQITTARTKLSHSTSTIRFPVTDLNNGNSTASVLTSLLSGENVTSALFLHLTNSQAGGHLTPTS
jgi:hypothetical protein